MPNGLALAINILIVLALLSYIVSMILNFFSPYYSTPRKFLKEIVSRFNLKENEKFADLGCGDGRVVWEVYRTYKCISHGYEFSPVQLIYIKLSKALLAPFNKKIQFFEEDFFKVNLKEYDVIYCNLPENILAPLEEKFSKELKKGSRVYTFRYKLPNKKGKSIKVGERQMYEYIF